MDSHPYPTLVLIQVATKWEEMRKKGFLFLGCFIEPPPISLVYTVVDVIPLKEVGLCMYVSPSVVSDSL